MFPPATSFNPYSFGCVAERLPDVEISSKLGWFQSLFFWMCRWKISDTRFEHNHLSFNPYSFGCVAERILIRSNENFKINEFQSLFFWMCRWKHLAYQFFFFHLLVSILILLDVSLKDSDLSKDNQLDYGFNPYSFGCVAERGI